MNGVLGHLFANILGLEPMISDVYDIQTSDAL